MPKIPRPSDLRALTQAQLKSTLKRMGISTTGNKPELAQRIHEHLTAINNRQAFKTIVSLDIGYINLGYTRVARRTGGYLVQDWALLNPQMPQEYNAYKYAVQSRDLIQKRIHNPQVDAYLVEKQSWRVGAAIPTAVLRSNSFEAMIISQLVLMNSAPSVFTVSPSAVASHFALDATTPYNYKSKKRAGVRCLEKLISDGIISVPKELMSVYDKNSKKDDLSDCVLQAIAFFEWEVYTRQFSLGAMHD